MLTTIGQSHSWPCWQMAHLAAQKMTPTCIQDIHPSSTSVNTCSGSQDSGAFPGIHRVRGRKHSGQTLDTHLHSLGEIGVSTFQFNWPAWLWTEAPKDNLPKDKENMHTVQRSYGWYSTPYDILTVYDYGYDVTSIPIHRAKFSSCMNWMQNSPAVNLTFMKALMLSFFVETVVEKFILKAGVCGLVEKVKSYTFCPPQLY